MQIVDVSLELKAPIDTAWRLLSDHESWTRWAGFGRVVRERDGAPEQNGVGAIRRMPGGGREEVVRYGPGFTLGYRVISGLPLRDHLGEVDFAPLGPDRFQARWRCRFDSTIPGAGPLMRVGVTWIFRRMLRRLERAASK